MFYELTPNGICFCTSATLCSLAMGLKDFRWPEVSNQQRVLLTQEALDDHMPNVNASCLG